MATCVQSFIMIRWLQKMANFCMHSPITRVLASQAIHNLSKCNPSCKTKQFPSMMLLCVSGVTAITFSEHPSRLSCSTCCWLLIVACCPYPCLIGFGRCLSAYQTQSVDGKYGVTNGYGQQDPMIWPHQRMCPGICVSFMLGSFVLLLLCWLARGR
jgi:hypothetical protein